MAADDTGRSGGRTAGAGEPGPEPVAEAPGGHWMTRRRFLKIAAAAVPAVCAADALLVEPGWLAVRRVDLRRADSRPAMRIVHLTDLHHKGNEGFLERVISTVNSLGPDAVCFTGDLVEEERHLAGALAGLAKIETPVYGVPGNHDHWSGADFGTIARAFEATGGAWLVDAEARTADGSLLISGSDDNGTAFISAPQAGDGARRVVLAHFPVFADELARDARALAFDAILAGHSHGGQVRLPFAGALKVPYNVGVYDLGLYPTPTGPMYVSAGIGWWYLPVRFLCRPEVVVIEL